MKENSAIGDGYNWQLATGNWQLNT